MDQKGLRQAKTYLNDIGPDWFQYLKNHSRTEVRTIVGFLTGHFTFNKHLKLLGIVENSKCRFCGEEDEDSEHLIFKCPTFEQRRTFNRKQVQLVHRVVHPYWQSHESTVLE